MLGAISSLGVTCTHLLNMLHKTTNYLLLVLLRLVYMRLTKLTKEYQEKERHISIDQATLYTQKLEFKEL